ncbi:MAG TPA: hypothetical protein VG737_10010 [Cyclobacteriaceae bacterium]|nr:hypothetical protein [Cyclobacteriaceae bacterium]
MNSAKQTTQRKGSILSIIDFSESSINSLKWAVELARDKNTHLTILYPYRLNQTEKDTLSESKRNLDTEAEKSFNKLARPLLSEGMVNYDFRPEIGFIYDRVYSHTSRNNIMFIVAPQKMAIANKDVFCDLINIITVPLVIVPEKIKS